MGCACNKLPRREDNTRALGRVQTAWEDRLCSPMLPQEDPRASPRTDGFPERRHRRPGSSMPQEDSHGDSPRRRRKAEVSIQVLGLTGTALPFDIERQESLNSPSCDQTLFIFDWDDTLYPNTWVKQHVGIDQSKDHLAKVRHDNDEGFGELCVRVVELLRAAQQLGKVVVVTNSRDGWVDKSSEAFMPEIRDIISEIPVFYALKYLRADEVAGGRMSYHFFVVAKARAMSDVISSDLAGIKSEQWKNIICIGDSPAEHDAIRQLAEQGWSNSAADNGCRAKTVKLLGKPSLDLLTAQVSSLPDLLTRIVHVDENIDCGFVDKRQ